MTPRDLRRLGFYLVKPARPFVDVYQRGDVTVELRDFERPVVRKGGQVVKALTVADVGRLVGAK